MSGQGLVYLGNNACFHVGMESVSQLSERSWWRHHDEGLRLVRPDHLFYGRGDLSRDAVLFDVMPIGRFDSAFGGLPVRPRSHALAGRCPARESADFPPQTPSQS